MLRLFRGFEDGARASCTPFSREEVAVSDLRLCPTRSSPPRGWEERAHGASFPFAFARTSVSWESAASSLSPAPSRSPAA